MARLYTWPSVVGTAALVALPVIAAAQTTGTTPHTPTTEPQTETRTQATQDDSPRQHLEKAKHALDQVPRDAVTGKKSSKLNELKRHVSALDKDYRETAGSTTGAAQRSETGREQAGSSGDWNTHLSAADRALTDLLGAEGQTADATRTETGATGTTGTTGTMGTTGSAERDDNALDPQVRAQLEEVRRHLTAFAAAASGTTASGTMGATSSPSSSPSTSSPDSTTPPTSSTTTPDPTQPDPTSQPTQPSQPPTTGSTGTTTGTPATSQAAQSNVDQAREHLSQARQALADLTALPQAQQLTGETRNQVSQLISQFNTLITTEENWQAHYQEVNQTLTQMLSAEAGATSGTPASPGTSGAVGTSGATDSQLDPAVRNQLVQFQTHLQAFHAAASGTEGASGATSGTSGATSGMTGSPSSTTGASSSTTGTSSSSGSSMTSGTSPQTGTQTSPSTGTGQAGSMTGSRDAERHIAEIERIVNEALGTSSATGTGTASGTSTTGTTSGSTSATTTGSTAGTSTGTAGTAAAGATVTVERAKLEEIQRHLQQLRQSIR